MRVDETAVEHVGRQKRRRGRPSSVDRRDQIVEVTMNLLARRGVDGTTVARIAEAVGVTEGALYRHFDSREEILRAASDVMRQKAHEWITTPKHPNVLDRLRGIAQSHSSFIAAETPDLSVMPFALMVSNPDLGLREQTRDGHMENIAVLAAIIEEGKEQGVVRADVDSELVAWQFMRLFWAEDISALMGLAPSANAYVSSKMLDQILTSISTPGCRASGEGGGASREAT